MNVLGDILNAGEIVEYQEYYGFTGSFFKIAPTVIDEYTKKKLMNMQLVNLRFQRNIENIDKQTHERNQINMIEKNVSDERNHIYEKDENRSTNDIEVLKPRTLCIKIDIYIILKNNMMKAIR